MYEKYAEMRKYFADLVTLIFNSVCMHYSDQPLPRVKYTEKEIVVLFIQLYLNVGIPFIFWKFLHIF